MPFFFLYNPIGLWWWWWWWSSLLYTTSGSLQVAIRHLGQSLYMVYMVKYSLVLPPFSLCNPWACSVSAPAASFDGLFGVPLLTWCHSPGPIGL
ncbi:hypothetical protein BS47DRAFT_123766 [Hydnum rufescens UP504]|uniref:Uncharacterized protein n=1 Tax=Hydnum rufescens UP504 TaxID=1448309 RepID=A0A9P6B7P6_9AGAM|nr:hypothetical protein BS47DRAFT_123766 [Hydnum rufescens UP504]